MFKNYKVIKKAISKDMADLAVTCAHTAQEKFDWMSRNNLIPPKNTNFGSWGDSQINNEKVFCYYGMEFFDSLLLHLQHKVEKVIGYPLKPMYSYFRAYVKGAELNPHIDRAECALSTTLNLGGDPWPIYLKVKDKTVKVDLKPGDMLIYEGCNLEHWRKTFKKNKCYQVFLHYNDVQTSVVKFDGRPVLGIAKHKNL
jgi:hypothetical protein